MGRPQCCMGSTKHLQLQRQGQHMSKGPKCMCLVCRFEVEGQPSLSSEASTATSTAPLLSRLAAAGASCVGCTTTDDLHLGWVLQPALHPHTLVNSGCAL